MFETIGLFALGSAGVLLAILYYIRGRIRTRGALSRWASRRGFKLLSQRQPFITELSPFRITASKAQQVFRVEVEDIRGARSVGWVRLGSAWRGLSSQAAEERLTLTS